MEYLHELLHLVCEGAILMFEFIGVAILVFTGIMGIINYIRKNPYTRLELAKGMALGLEFKMGGEILRTVGVTGWDDIGKVAAIIILRAALTFLIHWEIKTEEKECEALNCKHNSEENK